MAYYDGVNDRKLWADIIVGVGTSVVATLITIWFLKKGKVI